MCAPTAAPSSTLADVLASPAAMVAAAVIGSGATLAMLAGGSTILAWAVIGLTGWAALSTIALIAVLASPKRKVVVQAAPAPPRRPQTTTGIRVLSARPRLALAAPEQPAISYVTAHCGAVSTWPSR